MTAKFYSRFISDELFFYFLLFSSRDYVTRFIMAYFYGFFFFSRWSPNSRSVSIKFVGSRGRWQSHDRGIDRPSRTRRSINLDLNLSSSREHVARNPRCFFRFMASAFQLQLYSFALTLRKHTLSRSVNSWQLFATVIAVALSVARRFVSSDFWSLIFERWLGLISRRYKSDS